MQKIILRVEKIRTNNDGGVTTKYYVNDKIESMISVSRFMTNTYYEDGYGIFNHSGDFFYKAGNYDNGVYVEFREFDFDKSSASEIISELKRRAELVRSAIEASEQKPRVFDIAEKIITFY